MHFNVVGPSPGGLSRVLIFGAEHVLRTQRTYPVVFINFLFRIFLRSTCFRSGTCTTAAVIVLEGSYVVMSQNVTELWQIVESL